MTEKHFKKCSTSLVIKEMQIKMTLRLHFTQVRMYKTENSSAAHADKDMEQGEHSSIAGGSANLYNHFRNEFSSFSEN